MLSQRYNLLHASFSRLLISIFSTARGSAHKFQNSDIPHTSATPRTARKAPLPYQTLSQTGLLFIFFYLPQHLLRHRIQQIIFMPAVRVAGVLARQVFHTVYLFLEIPRRIQPAALAADDDLFQAVRRRHHHRIFPPVFMGKFFNILIGRLRLLRKDHMDVVIIRHLRLVSLHPVGIKHSDNLDAAASLVITENIQQFSAGTVDVELCQII